MDIGRRGIEEAVVVKAKLGRVAGSVKQSCKSDKRSAVVRKRLSVGSIPISRGITGISFISIAHCAAVSSSLVARTVLGKR